LKTDDRTHAGANGQAGPGPRPAVTYVWDTAREFDQCFHHRPPSADSDPRHRIPAELRERPQWVVWKYEPDKANTQWTKVPYRARDTLRKASTTDPATWATFEEALSSFEARRDAPGRGIVDGFGFVFTADDPYCGIDLDRSKRESGGCKPWAFDILEALHSYTETSPSGLGVKVIVRAKLPGKGNKKTGLDKDGGAVEMYDRARFFTITGATLDRWGRTIEDRAEAVAALHARLFPAEPKPEPEPKPERRRAPRPPATPPVGPGDEELIELARRHNPRFSPLFDHGDTAGNDGDDSAADFALCGLLAYWTGCDAAAIDRIFRRSALYRAKWDEPRGQTTYGAVTVAEAIAKTGKVHEPPAPAEIGRTSADGDGAETSANARGPDGGRERRETQAGALLRLAEAAELGRTDDGRVYARVPVADHEETHEVRSTALRRWLARAYYDETGRPPSSDALRSVLEVLEAKGFFDGPTVDVFVRVAPGGGGAVVLDLGDGSWRAAVVRPGEWEVVDDPGVWFRRPSGLRALPDPGYGGTLEDLRRFVNVSDADFPLLVAWLTAAVLPTGPYPLLGLSGEQGAAKSTLAKVLRALIDPHVSPLRSEPREARDLMIGAANSWCVTFDNLSGLPGWLSDGLCRLATGGGFATRQLYTDAEEVFLDAQRPVILSAIEDVVRRGDLADRALFLQLPAIAEADRCTESGFWAGFDAAHGRLFGALLSSVAGGLRLLPSVTLSRLPRMADFARWGEAVCRSQGWPPGAFLGAYERNRRDAHEAALDDSPVAAAVRSLAAECPGWEGTPRELLDELNRRTPDRPAAPPWPKSPRGLSGQLRRLAPALRAAGLSVEFLPRENVRRVIRLRPFKVGDQPSPPSPPSPEVSFPGNPGDGGDGRDGSDRHQPSPTDRHPIVRINPSPARNLWCLRGGQNRGPMTVVTVVTVVSPPWRVVTGETSGETSGGRPTPRRAPIKPGAFLPFLSYLPGPDRATRGRAGRRFRRRPPDPNPVVAGDSTARRATRTGRGSPSAGPKATPGRGRSSSRGSNPRRRSTSRGPTANSSGRKGCGSSRPNGSRTRNTKTAGRSSAGGSRRAREELASQGVTIRGPATCWCSAVTVTPTCPATT
jgi:hypothetical protein